MQPLKSWCREYTDTDSERRRLTSKPFRFAQAWLVGAKVLLVDMSERDWWWSLPVVEFRWIEYSHTRTTNRAGQRRRDQIYPNYQRLFRATRLIISSSWWSCGYYLVGKNRTGPELLSKIEDRDIWKETYWKNDWADGHSLLVPTLWVEGDTVKGWSFICLVPLGHLVDPI